MERKTGKEMRGSWSRYPQPLLLVLAVIAYFLIDVIVTNKQQHRENKDLVIEQSVLSLVQIGEKITELSGARP